MKTRYRGGDIVKVGTARYLIAQVDVGIYKAIGLDNGNRYSDDGKIDVTRRAFSAHELRKQDVQKMLGGNEFTRVSSGVGV